jgi:hypothetical protein
MIRPVLTEIGIFLIPFAIYALFLITTRSGLLVQSSWPVQIVAKLVLGSLLLVVISFILLAHFSGAPPNSTYTPRISRTASWFAELKNEHYARARPPLAPVQPPGARIAGGTARSARGRRRGATRY